MAIKSFNAGNFLVRLIIAIALVFATYNPSGYSWYHWLVKSNFAVDPIIILAGILLLIGWIIFLRATFRSLGVAGTILATAFFGVIVWALIYYKWLSLDNVTSMQYVILLVLSAILATGMSWSHIRRRMTGQLDVDDIEDSA
ncbi:MAG: DUF6524 family protein [Pseudomonadota bacterium]|nr:DUF6524 family protein [Pseudomonadota bacterium]